MELKSGVQKSLDALLKVAPAHGATPLAAPSPEGGGRPVGGAPQRALPSTEARGPAAGTVDWPDIVAEQNAALAGQPDLYVPPSNNAGADADDIVTQLNAQLPRGAFIPGRDQ